jgi:hypothetical protein
MKHKPFIDFLVDDLKDAHQCAGELICLLMKLDYINDAQQVFKIMKRVESEMCFNEDYPSTVVHVEFRRKP